MDWSVCAGLVDISFLCAGVKKVVLCSPSQEANKNNPHKQFKSSFPAHNAQRRNEDLVTDQMFSDTPAINCGYAKAQFFAGCSAGVPDIIGLAKKSDFPKTSQDMKHF